MNFRFVSSGQAVADAAGFSQVLRGRSLLPLAPVNVTGSRNANGDLVIEWTRRSRIGIGMRPSTNMPLAEEAEIYDVEIMNGSNVAYTERVLAGNPIPPQWAFQPNGSSGSLADVTIASDGSVSQNVDGGPTVVLNCKQKLTGDFFFEFTLNLASSTHTMADIQFEEEASAGNGDHAMLHLTTSGDSGEMVFDILTGTISGSFVFADGDRIGMKGIGTSLAFHRNYTQGSSPIYVSPYALGFTPRTIRAFINGNSGVNVAESFKDMIRPTLQRFQQPAMLYSAIQQGVNFGSTQSAIAVRVYQVSAIVGRGPAATATI